MDLLPIVRENMLDWESDLVIICQKCNGQKIPLKDLDDHKTWHGRINLLCRLGTLVKDAETPPFGPSVPGHLIRLSYEGSFDMCKTSVRDKVDLATYLDSSCCRYCTVQFIEGMKFTVGSKFVSRQSQGEFIFLDLNDGISDNYFDLVRNSFLKCHKGKAAITTVKENYFELQCRNGCAWIASKVEEKPSCSSSTPSLLTIVSINGVPLLAEPKKLGFGDIISVSVDSSEKGKTYCDFVFKATTAQTAKSYFRRISTSASVGSHGGQLNNPLILQNILRFLPAQSLKRMRFISQFWNTEALKVLRNRVVVTICMTKFPIRQEQQDYFMQISDFVHSQVNTIKFPNWNIELPVSNAGEKRKAMEEKKVLQDLEWFLLGDEFNHNVQTLCLSQKIISEKGFQMCQVVLSGLGKTLTTLDFKLNIISDMKLPLKYTFQQFSSLKSLSLSVDGPGCTMASFEPQFKAFFKNFIPAVQSIQTLILANTKKGDRDDSLTTISHSFGKMVIEEIVAIQTEHPEKFSSLNEIRIGYSSNDQLRPLCSLRESSLRKLELRDLSASPASDQLCPVLEKHSSSLEELTLNFNVRSRLNINFPARVQKLKSLAIYCHLDRYAKPSVLFKFGREETRRIDFRKQFPSLSKLVLWPADRTYSYEDILPKTSMAPWNSFLPILDAFTQLSPLGEITSVSSVDLPFLLNEKYNTFLDNLERTFPNVNFPPALEEARKGMLSRARLLPVNDSDSDMDSLDDDDEDMEDFSDAPSDFFDYENEDDDDIDDDDIGEEEESYEEGEDDYYRY